MPPLTAPLAFTFALGAVHSPDRSPSSPAVTTSNGIGSTAPKRQRSASPDETESTPLSTPRPIAAQKRVRAKRGSPPASVDVGKMLATLDRSSLLTVFSRLLANEPLLAERIQPLIPTPTITSVESALDEAQRSIRQAAVNASEMRAEFAWGRLRNPTAEFVSCALGFMPFFVAKDGDAPHPSVTFAYLHLVTERAQHILAFVPATPTNLSASLFSPDASNPVVTSPMSGTPKEILRVYQDALASPDKMSALNPNTVVCHLIPAMLLHWAELVDCIARNVNDEGRMFGGEMVRGWLGALESLTRQRSSGQEGEGEKEEEKACRVALFAVGQRLQEQIGWLVGRHAGSRGSASMEF